MVTQAEQSPVFTLPPLHPGQAKVLQSRARFKVLACGRRWGKTRLSAVWLTSIALQGGRGWWVGPEERRAKEGWYDLVDLSRMIPGARSVYEDKILYYPGGGMIEIRSAHDPDQLRGAGLQGLVFDEAAFVQSEDVWDASLLPTLLDYKAPALIPSTPKGRNWFWRLYQQGLDPAFPDVESFNFPTVTNPYIDPAEIEQIRLRTPERTFRQEYLAEFLDDAGGVFRYVRDAVNVQTDKYDPDHQYVIGVDWGKEKDFSVFICVDVTEKRVVEMLRSNKVEYALQRGRLMAMYERWLPVVIIAEENNIGKAVREQLERDGLPIRPFVTSNTSKQEIIDQLALAFEQHTISLPDDPVLLGELEAYEMQRLPSGRMRYQAPNGMHDDCVMALALAWSQQKRARRSAMTVRRNVPSYLR